MSSYLPEEIILDILSRLEVKPLLRFRCVCKSWCNLLSTHDFVKMHLNHVVEKNNDNKNCSFMINGGVGHLYSIDFVSSSCYEAVKIHPPIKSGSSVDILGSCNGLLCKATDFRSIFYILNPSTKEYKEISLPPITKWSYYVAYGFGYDCKIDDYKLIRIVRFPSVNVNMEVNVYTLGSNSWRTIQSVPHKPFVATESVGVLLNGALHWIARPIGSQVIVSFGIGDERFQDIELPNCLVGTYTSNVGVLIGELCILGHMRDSSHDLWVMKDYGVIESWTKLFSIARDTSISYLKPLHSFKNDNILFEVQLNKKDHQTYGLVSYDPNRERARALKIRGFPKWHTGIDTFVGSLVSPNRGKPSFT